MVSKIPLKIDWFIRAEMPPSLHCVSLWLHLRAETAVSEFEDGLLVRVVRGERVGLHLLGTRMGCLLQGRLLLHLPLHRHHAPGLG